MCAARTRGKPAGLVLLLILAGLGAPEIARSQAQRWIEEGRVAARADNHARAIEAYRRAVVEDPALSDSVALPLGAQLTWAGRMDEAIVVFERFLERHPGDTEAWKALALAQSWDDRLDDALASYDRALSLEPEDPDATFGAARVLAWKGDLEGSLEAYDRLLERDPDFHEAALGRAQVTNWRGDHLRAARLYSEILEERPADTPALEGRAASWNLAGRADRALEDLAQAERGGALTTGGSDLRAAITRAWGPSATSSVDFSKDSDDFELLTLRLEGELPLAFRTRLRGFMIRNAYEKPGRPDVEDLWVGVGGESRLADRLILYGSAQALADRPAGVDSDHAAGDLHLAYLPGDRVRIDAGYGRAAFFTYERSPDGSPRFIDGNFVDLGATLRPTWRTTVLVAGDHGWYSDENSRTLLRTRVRQAFLFRPRLWGEAGFTWIDFERDLGGGLWTPQDFRSLLLAGEAEWTAQIWLILNGRIETGWARDRASEADPYLTVSAAARIESGVWRIELRGGRADSNLETGRGYRRTFAGLTVRVGF